jgi:hypothetical protein
VQKQLALKCTAKPICSQHHVLVVNIHSQYPVIYANRLFPSLIKSAAAKILNLLRETVQTMPHRKGTNLSPKIWILCLTPLLVCVPRTPRVLTNLVRLLTLYTFSLSFQSRSQRNEYANYACKSCITCQQASNDSILSDKHGYEDVPSGVLNYVYEVDTGKTNCCKHLVNRHMAIYDKTFQKKKWPYHLSTKQHHTKTTVGELCKHALPSFTVESFIDYLVRFIVANSQVSNLFRSVIHMLTFF